MVFLEKGVVSKHEMSLAEKIPNFRFLKDEKNI